MNERPSEDSEGGRERERKRGKRERARAFVEKGAAKQQEEEEEGKGIEGGGELNSPFFKKLVSLEWFHLVKPTMLLSREFYV